MTRDTCDPNTHNKANDSEPTDKGKENRNTKLEQVAIDRKMTKGG